MKCPTYKLIFVIKYLPQVWILLNFRFRNKKGIFLESLAILTFDLFRLYLTFDMDYRQTQNLFYNLLFCSLLFIGVITFPTKFLAKIDKKHVNLFNLRRWPQGVMIYPCTNLIVRNFPTKFQLDRTYCLGGVRDTYIFAQAYRHTSIHLDTASHLRCDMKPNFSSSSAPQAHVRYWKHPFYALVINRMAGV